MTQGRYWAFISYSHADERVATWLHKALETYRLPKKLVGTAQGGVEVPSRLFPVFRDRDELPSSDSLGAKISDALTRAESLIVIASRQSAASHWVNEEIRTFKALGKGRRVFCVIADGEPFASGKGEPAEECFAPALRRQVGADGQLTDERAEPIAADIRPGKDGRRDALLKLVAGVLDIGLDVLKQRDAHRRQRRLTAIAAAAVAASVFTTGLSFFAIQSRNEAQAQRRLAEARQTQAEGLIQFLLGDLRKKLEPIGKLDILDAVGEQAMAYFGQVAPEQLSDTELAARAQALRQIGDVRVQQGKLADASPAFEEALRLDEELVRRHPGDQQAIFNMAQSEYYIGARFFYSSMWPETRPWFERYENSANRLFALDPENPVWRQELIYAMQNNGLLAYQSGDCPAAIDYSDRLDALARDASAAVAASDELLISRSEGLKVSALCQIRLGRLDEAESRMLEQVALREELLMRAPQNAHYMYLLANALEALSEVQIDQGRLQTALESKALVLERLRALIERDASNHQWRGELLDAQTDRAVLLILLGRGAEAYRGILDATPDAEALLKAEFNPLQTRANAVHLASLQLALNLSGLSREDLGGSLARTLQSARLRWELIADPQEVPQELAVACALIWEAAGKSRTSMALAPCDSANVLPVARSSEGLHWQAQALRAHVAGEMLENQPAVQNLSRTPFYSDAHWHLLLQRVQLSR